MGIFGAMSTAISGLKAQSFALERISDNIANSQTTAYKRSDTSFADYVPESPSNQQALGVVTAFSRPTVGVQGDVTNVDTPTYMAINGDGFFVVAEQASTADGQPVFAGTDLYTRRGDFTLNRDGYLVNATGYYLKGLTIDPTTGNPSGSQPEIIQVSTDFVGATPTTRIDYRANLASYPKTADADPTVPGSELLDPSLYAIDPTTTGSGTVSGDDATTFINQSVSGGAITSYDASGQAVNVQLRWAKVDSVTSGGADTWNLFYLADSAATGAAVAWKNAGTAYGFGANGQMNPQVPNVTLTALTVNGVPLGDVQLSHGANGVTQFADPNGIAKVTEISQNGSAAGEISGVFVSDEGRITARYTNGRSVELAVVALATFNGVNGLAKTDGGAYRATPESGSPIIGALGTVVGGALENSNTDIADEFTKLIVTQQAYAAGTRIITTGDEMLQEALNMVR